MKVILLSIGTRGDVEPFLAIGEILQDRGIQVICAFPEQFRKLTEGAGLMNNTLFKQNAGLIALDMQKENYLEELYETILMP